MSLSETVVEKTECPKCGADIRPDSQFCYNCGGQIEAELEPATSSNGDEWVTDPLAEKRPAPGLKTAREIKRRERVFQRRVKEVAWEPADIEPNVQLIIVTVIAVVFTLAVVMIALYLS
jgi:hypothetical protein